MNYIFPKTDLADECDEVIKEHGYEPDGLISEKHSLRGTDIFTLRVTNSIGEKLSGKPIGKYTTINIGKASLLTADRFRDAVFACADILKSYIGSTEGKSILIAGLGNSAIGADSVGEKTVNNIIVTRHIKENKRDLFTSLGLADTSAILPGVLGKTGVEAADIISGVCKMTEPDIIIVIDALSSRRISRILSTIQICDSGISPGSGVGNARKPITYETMNRPVIAIGIPTVANAQWVFCDMIAEFGEVRSPALCDMPSELDCYVTPKDTESELSVISKLCGYSVNLSIHTELTYDEIPDFL